MKPISFYQYISFLSLDVVLGVMVSSSFVTYVTGSEFNVFITTALALVVWAIYTFDHLVDAQFGNPQHMTGRHQFHLRHFQFLTWCLIADLIIVSVLLFFLPIKTILLGALLGLVVLAYFLTIHFIKWESVFHKELMIAVVYCTGLIITPLSSEASSMHWENIFMLSPMFLLVMANLLLFAQKDISFDEASNFPSASQSIGYKTTAKIIQVIWLLFLTNLSFLLLYENIGITIIYSLMFMMLFMISKFDRYPFVELHFRHIGDGVFLIPALYFLL